MAYSRRLGVCLLSVALGLAASLEARAGATLRVMTSFYPMYIHALNVAGGVPGVDVTNLTPQVTGCLHDYQFSPADLVRLTRADVLIVNGAGMESFLDRVASQAPKVKIIHASEGIELTADRNPHVWVSISLAIRQVRTIEAGLSRLDPVHAPAFRDNAAAYVRRLEELRDRMRSRLKGIRHRDIVTLHEAFSYFADEFGLRIVGVVEREPGSEPGAKELAALIRLVRERGVKAVFAEPQYPRSAADAVAAETGARVYVLDPAVSGAMDADAYLRAMEANLKVLEKALGS